MKPTFDPASTEKCIVKGCTNHKNEGYFIGEMCSPCHEMVTSGVVKPTNSFIGDLKYEMDKLRVDNDALEAKNVRLLKGMYSQLDELDALEARNEELERKLGYRKGFAAVNPYRARIDDLENALNKCCNALWLASYASCTCLTKTPDSKYHAENCWYRTIREAYEAARELL